MADEKPTFQNKNIEDYSLDELNEIDSRLEEQEKNFLIAIQHSKFEKFSPKPQMNLSFVKLRKDIKDQIKVHKNA